jgi:damage-control phosphatase, subfamily III
MNLDPPLAKAVTSDPTSFAYTSARSRWPAIITSAIDDVHRTISALPSSQHQSDSTDVSEGKKIVSSLATLKYELQHNRSIAKIPDDGDADSSTYNNEVGERATNKTLLWHDVQWLFSECFLYRYMSSIFKTSPSQFWRGYDCFRRQKMSTFRSSRGAVVELAGRYREVISKLREDGKVLASKEGNGNGERKEEEAEELLFKEMAEICLWGNATDLSLLTQLTYEDIQKLQGSNARKESESKILVNDLSSAFAVLNAAKKEGKKSRRVDIVLDNAGFELYVDLVLAGYLIQTGLATEIVLHPKSIPWFVSDVVPRDLVDLLEVLCDPRGFYESSDADDSDKSTETVKLSEQEEQDLNFLFEHWGGLHQDGHLILRPNRFWTAPGSFWRMPHWEKGLFEDLKESELVLFKGDLNYRKLTGDVSSIAWS